MKKECTENPLREVFHWHLLHECKWRMVNCEYCAREIVACQLKVGLLGNLCERLSMHGTTNKAFSNTLHSNVSQKLSALNEVLLPISNCM